MPCREAMTPLAALALARPDEARVTILVALDAANGNRTRTAARLGVSYRQLRRIVARLELEDAMQDAWPCPACSERSLTMTGPAALCGMHRLRTPDTDVIAKTPKKEEKGAESMTRMSGSSASDVTVVFGVDSKISSG